MQLLSSPDCKPLISLAILYQRSKGEIFMYSALGYLPYILWVVLVNIHFDTFEPTVAIVDGVVDKEYKLNHQ